jgi:hypothetical protein
MSPSQEIRPRSIIIPKAINKHAPLLEDSQQARTRLLLSPNHHKKNQPAYP